VFLALFLSLRPVNAQPSAFTWYNKHYNKIDPISPEKNQREPGPCTIFASVAAVEAMSSIYYNKNGSLLKLSESSVYNAGILYDCLGLACESGPGVGSALSFMQNTGVIDNQSYAFPITGPICRTDCQDIFEVGHYSTKVKIPGWEQLTTITGTQAEKETALKKAIMDYGPIIVTLGGQYGNYYVTHYLYPETEENRSHTVLILGWSDSGVLNWHIKDSWYEYPYPDIWYVSTNQVNLFDFSPEFYRVYPLDENSNPISCVGTGCSTVFGSRPCLDQDGDGFYNWGMNPKPENSPGINLMDIDDGNSSIIFRDGYDVLEAPIITGATYNYLCPGNNEFLLDNFDDLPSGFSVHWSIMPAYYFNSDSCGNTATAVVNPNIAYIGKKCKIKYTLYYGETKINTYKWEFTINGPREDLVSISVLDSYGGSPAKYGDTYYLCPYTTYMIYYNNYDYNCTTTDLDWVLPYSWTEYWRSNNYISIHTNDWPDGFLEIWAKTSCCSPYSRVKVFTQYFGAAECGGYFMAFPNPSSDFVDIDAIKDKISSEELASDIKTSLSIIDKVGTVKIKTEFKGFPYRVNTSDLPDGLYFLYIQFNDKKSTIRLVIKH